MELREAVFCENVCSSDFSCNWSKWNNPFNQQFPDGTTQTCVGAQVRCGCTTTMNIISYVTYEHPSVVTVLFFVIGTLFMFFILKCVIEHHCCIFCCFRESVYKKRSMDLSSTLSASSSEELGDLFDTATGRSIGYSQNPVQIYFIELEKPPSYSYVMRQELENLPPSYAECIKNIKPK